MLLEDHRPNVKGPTQEQVLIGDGLAGIARIPPWIESLASRYAIPAKVQFAANLCLEEVLSNIFLHGYRERAKGVVTVRFAKPRNGYFLFTVEDEAPHFNPLAQEVLPALNPNEEMRIGGQGLRFLHEFSDELAYERLPAGNRLNMFFSGDTCDPAGKEGSG